MFVGYLRTKRAEEERERDISMNEIVVHFVFKNPLLYILYFVFTTNPFLLTIGRDNKKTGKKV